MASRDFRSRLVRRAKKSGVEVGLGVIPKLEAYFALLSKWNKRINLTGLALEPPSDEAIDRLFVEPLAASRNIAPGDKLCIDVGSGGGSPGIPFHLAQPGVRLVLVEVKVRKSAFLREVVRQLELPNVEVENRRFEELLARADLLESADIVTLRAVRPDARLWNTVQAFLRPGGRVFWFDSADGERMLDVPMLVEVDRVPLVPALGSRLTILNKSKNLVL